VNLTENHGNQNVRIKDTQLCYPNIKPNPTVTPRYLNPAKHDRAHSPVTSLWCTTAACMRGSHNAALWLDAPSSCSSRHRQWWETA